MPNRDPSGTGKLRRQFASVVRERWRFSESLVRQGLVERDMFGLSSQLVPIATAATAFSNWLRAILMQQFSNNYWARPYIERAYAMGAQGSGGTSLELLVASHSTETNGVLEAVVQQAARAFNSSLVRRRSPTHAMTQVRGIMRKVGLLRSLLSSHVAIVGAHASGTLDRLERAGVRRVAVIPEHVPYHAPAKHSQVRDAARRTRSPSRSTIGRIRRRERSLEELGRVNVLTAGDDKVCQICEDIAEDGPYLIDQARGLIPAHPRCRCAFEAA